ncbi:cytochrome P450 family protein [Teratosphaeria nubilosa]|uniref:Cytochrome P450 family protein n=1 Tax=Teratosphaeria nubilosa TaxID=161662 RepID=A0A6G1KWE5_9PEZI|nr:cytochrome P450 family protein [Teratosphaeria nubilosa]
MIALHEKHGPLVRTGPNEVSVSDLTAIKQIYGARTRFLKSDWYSVWQGHRKFDLFAERDEKIHGEQRRLVSRAYSMDSMRDLEPYVDDAIHVFLTRMQEMQNQIIDMDKWVQLFAFDVIGEITFSKRFGFMDTGADDGSLSLIESALKSASWLGQIPSIYWLHDALTPYIGNHVAANNRHGSIRTFATREITAASDRGTDHEDMLSKFRATQKQKPEQMNDAAVVAMATSNIFAGSDTTAISLRAIIYHLLKNPACHQRFLEELYAARAEGRLSDPVKLHEADALPYLQAVMHEALRLHPAVGFSLPRVTPEGGASVAGTYIPAGTVIGANPWVVHRSKEVYGEDVEAFRPERWMGKEEEGKGDMQRFFFAFGSGARLCIGRNISWMEMSKLIPTLFMQYHVELSEPEKEWTMTSYWFVLQKGLNVRLTQRQH